MKNVFAIVMAALCAASISNAQTRLAKDFYPPPNDNSAPVAAMAFGAAEGRADADFNNDGVYGDERDVQAFLDCYSESDNCVGCDSIDIDRKGDFFDPMDQEFYLNKVRYGLPPVNLWRPPRNEIGYSAIPLKLASEREVFVSSEIGSDTNTGLIAASPKRTIAEATKLLRNNTGDRLLLRDGDVFNERLVIRDGAWTFGGGSPERPMIISRYSDGQERGPPTFIYRGTNPQFSSNTIQVMGDEFPGNLWIVGLRFAPEDRDTAHVAIFLYTSKNHIAIEGCAVEGGNSFLIADGIVSNGLNDLYVGYNSVARTKDAGGQHSGGAYLVRVSRVLVDGNTLDTVGWNGIARTPDCKFNQGFYIVGNFETAAEPVVFTNNYIFRPAHCGIQGRGQEIYSVWNIVVDAPIGISGGHAMLPAGCYWTGNIANNTIIGWAACPGAAQGESIRVSRGDGAAVFNNIFENPRLTIYREDPLGDIVFSGNRTLNVE